MDYFVEKNYKDIEMTSYKCPYCGNSFVVNSSNTVWFITHGVGSVYLMEEFDSIETHNGAPNILNDINYSDNGIDFILLTCPEVNCKQKTVVVNSYGNEFPNFRDQVAPSPKTRSVPNYVPEVIRNDIKEAELIVNLSPKASATLSRRVLQAMIRDFHQVSKGTLHAEIEAIKNKIEVIEYEGLMSFKSIANIGAHPDKYGDINIIQDIDPNEASDLVNIVHHFIETWYIKRNNTQQLFQRVNSTASNKNNQQTP